MRNRRASVKAGDGLLQVSRPVPGRELAIRNAQSALDDGVQLGVNLSGEEPQGLGEADDGPPQVGRPVPVWELAVRKAQVILDRSLESFVPAFGKPMQDPFHDRDPVLLQPGSYPGSLIELPQLAYLTLEFRRRCGIKNSGFS